MRTLVARLRVEIGADRCQVMVPQTHPAGEEAEVDFGEFVASIAGRSMKLYMFCMRLSHSGKAFHIAYANQTQESFLDGHVRAFEAFGGVPTGMIRYDNLKPAVIRVRWAGNGSRIPGSSRCARTTASTRSSACPGIDGAHEKGGVEGEIGRFRRRHLTPVPHVGSLAALNAALAAADARDDARRIAARTETVGQAAARELPLLRPLPGDRVRRGVARCRAGSTRRPGSACASPTTRCRPARRPAGGGRGWAPTTITVRDGAHGRRRARPVAAQGQRGPAAGPLPGGADPQAGRVGRRRPRWPRPAPSGAFTGAHQRFWDAARRRLGDGAGTRALIGVLLLHRTLPAAAVTAGHDAALGRTASTRTWSPSRPAAPSHPAPRRHGAGAATATVPSVTGRRRSLTGYDELLDAGERSA